MNNPNTLKDMSDKEKPKLPYFVRLLLESLLVGALTIAGALALFWFNK